MPWKLKRVAGTRLKANPSKLDRAVGDGRYGIKFEADDPISVARPVKRKRGCKLISSADLNRIRLGLTVISVPVELRKRRWDFTK